MGSLDSKLERCRSASYRCALIEQDRSSKGTRTRARTADTRRNRQTTRKFESDHLQASKCQSLILDSMTACSGCARSELKMKSSTHSVAVGMRFQYMSIENVRRCREVVMLGGWLEKLECKSSANGREVFACAMVRERSTVTRMRLESRCHGCARDCNVRERAMMYV
jgi:hypothetical protein